MRLVQGNHNLKILQFHVSTVICWNEICSIAINIYMIISFNTITPKSKSFPKPLLPIQPVLNLSTFSLFTSQNVRNTAFDKGDGGFYNNARTCLAHAFQLSGLNSKSAVLIPAYHCGSMVEPALWLNAEVLLYHIETDLSPKRSHLEQLIANTTKPIKAMLLTHYFGFPQDVHFWRTFCDTHEIKLIEDCSHAFFGTTDNGEKLGTSGDYAVTSIRKFFCSPNGGILIGKPPHTPHITPLKPDIKEQIIAVLQALLNSAEFGKLGIIGRIILGLDAWRTKLKKPPKKQVLTNKSQHLMQWQWIDPKLMNTTGLTASKFLMQHSNFQQIAKIRRQNYIKLIEGIANLPNIQPLYSELPANVVPYMVPLLLESSESEFDSLKQAGIPIWRWEELAKSDCFISQTYRLKLLHIPCHQDLTQPDIDWIIEKLRNVIMKKK